MNFAQVKGISIPQGTVKQLAQGQTVLWKKGGSPLPYDAEVAYLQSADGMQYIDCGFAPTQAIAFTLALTRPDNYTRWDCGAEEGWSSRIARLLIEERQTARWRYGSPGANTGNITGSNNCVGDLRIEVNGKAVTLYNDSAGTNYSATANNASFTAPGHFLLFAFTVGTTPTVDATLAGIRLVSAQISDTGVSLDLIAVRVGSVGYMYDRISGQLFGNAGTGAFRVGPDVSVVQSFLNTAVLTALPYLNVGGAKQGACTDGTYIYQFDYSNTRGIKYKISDGTYTVTNLDTNIPWNHGNDMAYNPNTGHIYVATMSADGAVIEIDTEWNYIATHYLVDGNGNGFAVFEIMYDRNTNRFLCDIGDYSIGVFDQNFGYLSTMTTPYLWATRQGGDTDGDFIYRIGYNTNQINVLTMDGLFVTTVLLPGLSEPETLMYDWEHGKYYINNQSYTNIFYEAQIRQ